MGPGAVPEDHFYRLGTLTAESRYEEPPFEGVLAVERVDAFGLLRDRALLYSEADTPQDLQRHHYHFWIDAPNDLVRDQLVQYLRSADVARQVAGEYIEEEGDLRLKLALRDFSRRLGGDGTVTVQVELDVVLNPKGRGAPLLVKRYRSGMRATNTGVAASVTAFDQALSTVYGELVKDVVAALPRSE